MVNIFTRTCVLKPSVSLVIRWMVLEKKKGGDVDGGYLEKIYTLHCCTVTS